jgi:hypothetical protein
MTQDKNEGSENLNWMEIADSDATNEVRHSGQRLPFIAAAVSLLIIGGGAVFAQTNNGAPGQAEETSVTQTSQTPSMGEPAMTPGGIPVIPNVAPGVGGYGDDEDDDDDDEDEDEDEDEDDD